MNQVKIKEKRTVKTVKTKKAVLAIASAKTLWNFRSACRQLPKKINLGWPLKSSVATATDREQLYQQEKPKCCDTLIRKFSLLFHKLNVSNLMDAGPGHQLYNFENSPYKPVGYF